MVVGGTALLVLVLALHWIALGSLHSQLQDGSALTPMPPPIFVRVMQPVRPVPPPPPRKAVLPHHRVAVSKSAIPSVDAAAASLPDAAVGITEQASPETPLGEGSTPAPDLPVVPEASAANNWPDDTRLTYSAKGYYRGDFYGSGQVQWQHKDGRYQVQVDGRMALIFTGTLISQGELSADGLQPRIYEERGMGRVRRVSFDGTDVTLNDGNTIPQPPDVQDTASQFVELSHRFSSGRQPLVVGAEVSVWLARPRQMNLWTYDVVALETLEIPAFGPVAAYHLQPRPVANPRGVIHAELWFAPSLQYLPVRIRINLGNDNYADLLVSGIEQGAAPVNDRR